MTAVFGVFTRSPAADLEPVPVTSCGQRVEGAAYLTGDLDCSGASTLHGVVLLAGFRRAKLDLRGFEIVGPPVSPGAAIRCDGNCDILGPGSVSGGVWGIAGAGRVRVFDTLVHDTGGRGTDGGLQRASSMLSSQEPEERR